MNIRKETINIGLDNPVKLFHITDTHICFADERDDERKIRLASSRDKYFNTEKTLKEIIPAIEKAKSEGMTVVHTGDFIDFVSYANIDKAKVLMNDVFFIDGNHEFSKYVGEAFEDENYLKDSLELVQSGFKDNIRFCSRVVGGINLVGIDDVYYHFRHEHFEMLKNEVSKGLPIVLCMHVPLYSPELFEITVKHDGVIAYLTGVPVELMDKYPENRRLQQAPTAFDMEVCKYIDECDTIKAIIAGHIHFPVTSVLPSGKPQIIGGVCSDACEITII